MQLAATTIRPATNKLRRPARSFPSLRQAIQKKLPSSFRTDADAAFQIQIFWDIAMTANFPRQNASAPQKVGPPTSPKQPAIPAYVPWRLKFQVPTALQTQPTFREIDSSPASHREIL